MPRSNMSNIANGRCDLQFFSGGQKLECPMVRNKQRPQHKYGEMREIAYRYWHALLIEKAFTSRGTTKTWYPIIAIPFSFKFVVICKLLICLLISHLDQPQILWLYLPLSMSLRAYITIRLLPSTLMILAVQLGVQLWLINLAIPPLLVASITVFSSMRNR